MQNDERETGDRQGDDPPPEEPRPEEPPQEPAVDEGDEFETASWPSQDTPPAADVVDPEQEEAAPSEQPESVDEAGPAVADSHPTDGPAPGTTAPGTTAPGTTAPDATGAEAAAETPAEDAAPPPPEVEAYGQAGSAGIAGMAAHSVPATEPGESTQCPRCGTLNRPGIAFCGNCGQRLVAAGAPTTVVRPAAPEGTQACPRCGTHNRAGVAFCQNCGANLEATEPGYVPPGVSSEVPGEAAADASAGHAILGPIVLLVGAIGIATGWLLPFAAGAGSLFDRAFGDPSGYGIAFWSDYGRISGGTTQAYFGFAAPSPILVALLVLLAIGGVVRARPGALQVIGLVVALVWSIGLLALFIVVEVLGGAGDDMLAILRGLQPAGIIFALASLIVMIGCFTRFGRG